MTHEDLREHLSETTRARLDARDARIRAEAAMRQRERDQRTVETIRLAVGILISGAVLIGAAFVAFSGL